MRVKFSSRPYCPEEPIVPQTAGAGERLHHTADSETLGQAFQPGTVRLESLTHRRGKRLILAPMNHSKQMAGQRVARGVTAESPSPRASVVTGPLSPIQLLDLFKGVEIVGVKLPRLFVKEQHRLTEDGDVGIDILLAGHSNHGVDSSIIPAGHD